MVEAQSRVAGRPGAADGQVDTRVLVRTDKWYDSEKAWPIWSFVTRAYAGAIDRDLSKDTTNAEISTDVSNVQLGGVQLCQHSHTSTWHFTKEDHRAQRRFKTQRERGKYTWSSLIFSWFKELNFSQTHD